MSSDWQTVSFGSVCNHSAFGPRFSSKEYDQNGNIACLRTKDIGIDGRIEFSTMPLAQLSEKSFSNHYLKEEDMVITRTGRVGTTAIFTEFNYPVVPGAFLIRFRLDQNIANPWFYRYFFNSLEGQQLIQSVATGSVQQNLNITNLHTLRIPLPPLVTQKAIANILGSLDDKIELNRQMNATLEAIAQTLFKSWFVNFDPVIDNALAAGNPIPEPLQERAEARKALGDHRQPLPEAIQQQFPNDFVFNDDLGWVPEGWDVQPLKKITTKIGSGATPRGGSKVYQDEGISLIRSQNVYDSNFVWAGLVHIAEDAAEKLKGVTVQTNDVLLNITGASILRTCVVDPQVLPARVNQHVAIIRAKDFIPSRFLHFHLLQPRTKDLLLGQNAGASREAVTKGHIEAVKIIVPSSKILTRFKVATDSLFEKTERQQRVIRVLENLRDTLLPKLLSGQLRIPDAEKRVAEVL